MMHKLSFAAIAVAAVALGAVILTPIPEASAAFRAAKCMGWSTEVAQRVDPVRTNVRTAYKNVRMQHVVVSKRGSCGAVELIICPDCKKFVRLPNGAVVAGNSSYLLLLNQSKSSDGDWDFTGIQSDGPSS